MKSVTKCSTSLALAALFVTGSANASLIGDSVDCDVQPDAIWSCSPNSATVVDPGIEFQLVLGTPVLDVDLDADSITMLATRGLTAGAGEFVTFSSLDWVNDPSGEIVGFELENGGVTGLDAGDITTTAHTVEFDFNGTGWNPGDFVKITLQVDHDVPVPEPASVALLGLSLLGFGIKRRRTPSS